MIAVFTETNGLLHVLCISIKNVLFGRFGSVVVCHLMGKLTSYYGL